MIQEKTTVSSFLRWTAIGKRGEFAIGHIVAPTLHEFHRAAFLKILVDLTIGRRHSRHTSLDVGHHVSAVSRGVRRYVGPYRCLSEMRRAAGGDTSGRWHYPVRGVGHREAEAESINPKKYSLANIAIMSRSCRTE